MKMEVGTRVRHINGLPVPGTVTRVWANGAVTVLWDDSSEASYPASQLMVPADL